MKNILSSLNESEKRRILEMHINKRSFLLEAVENKTVQLDCVAKTVNGIVVTQANLLANLCPAAKTTTTPAGQTPSMEQVIENMTNWNSSVINDKLAAFGATSIEVNGDIDSGMINSVVFNMKNPKEDKKIGITLTPYYQCRNNYNGNNAGFMEQYLEYFSKNVDPEGPTKLALLKQAAIQQCQSSQAKMSKVKVSYKKL
jgi:hypothetical protein